jgi:hypothetical protein
MSTYTTAQVISAAAQGQDLGAAAILDSAANVQASLNALEPLAASGKISSISLTDTGFSVMDVTPVQLTADVTVLKDIQGSFALTIDGSAANITAAGITGVGTTVEFSGLPTQYGITGAADGSSFTVSEIGTGRTSTDHFSGITELKFDNSGANPIIAFVASETPTVAGTVPSAQIAALYAAVLDRTPDSAGLAYYEAEAANPVNTILCLATQFLYSAEYNSAHNYAQTAAGDMQFITDSYANLLHRAPEAGAVTWYETNDINPVLAGATPGTAAYATAEVAAHALVLAHFSLSPEFLADVSIDAQNPASATHWLALI